MTGTWEITNRSRSTRADHRHSGFRSLADPPGAQREPVAVSSHGQITGYFIGPDEYEEFRRFRESRHSFATADLSEQKVKAIGASRMDARHKHLDSILDSK